MKKQYVAPQLTAHGNAAEITQVLGREIRTDFVFQNGRAINGQTDEGSRDITLPSGFNP